MVSTVEDLYPEAKNQADIFKGLLRLDQKLKYILAVLFVIAPFPVIMLFGHPGLGGMLVLLFTLPFAVLLVYLLATTPPSPDRERFRE